MKLLFIYNPRAGKSQIRSNLLDIIDIFTKAGYEVTARPTQAPGDAIRAVRKLTADSFDLIACCGGDGTLDEVVTGMMQCKLQIPVGYIPAGSTNDFAHSLRIPQNMMAAAERIMTGNSFACDIGIFNDDIFVYIAAFGVFTDVSYETRQDMKNLLGHMAYILEGMRRLPAIKSSRMKVLSEELEVEDDFLFGMITNSVSVGGFKGITGKNVRLDDGKFEVTLIKRPSNAMELNSLIAALVNRNINAECMLVFKTAHVIMESADELPWTLDGEYGGKHRAVTITNAKKAIKLLGVGDRFGISEIKKNTVK